MNNFYVFMFGFNIGAGLAVFFGLMYLHAKKQFKKELDRIMRNVTEYLDQQKTEK